MNERERQQLCDLAKDHGFSDLRRVSFVEGGSVEAPLRLHAGMDASLTFRPEDRLEDGGLAPVHRIVGLLAHRLDWEALVDIHDLCIQGSPDLLEIHDLERYCGPWSGKGSSVGRPYGGLGFIPFKMHPILIPPNFVTLILEAHHEGQFSASALFEIDLVLEPLGQLGQGVIR